MTSNYKVICVKKFYPTFSEIAMPLVSVYYILGRTPIIYDYLYDLQLIVLCVFDNTQSLYYRFRFYPWTTRNICMNKHNSENNTVAESFFAFVVCKIQDYFKRGSVIYF